VWTTLELTVHADGSTNAAMVGASAFPRHWVYGTDGVIASKSALTDESGWMRHSFGERTPWSDRDRAAFVTEVETQVERQLSAEIMRGGQRPEIRRLPEGSLLTRQGEPGDELYLVLDGVAVVEVDERAVAEVGPGAVVGERAILEEGLRTSTVRATTPLRVAVARRDAIDVEKMRALAETHRREDQPMGEAPTAPLD
jgi:Cyclic nucleotide-binding domain